MVARQLHAPGPRLLWPGHEPLPGRSLPARITVARTEETLDTPANRFIKFALTRWRDTAVDIGDALRREKPSAPVTRGLREVEALTNRLDGLLSEELFREVGPLTQFPAGDQVLQKREGYRDLFRTYVQFEAAAVLSWQGGEDVYGAGQRDVATLYEFWVFLQLAGTVAKICQRSFDLSGLVEVNPDHLGVGLRRGRQTVVSGSVARLGRTLHAELWFNRSFGARGTGAPSWTRPMRPDCSLRISIDRETSAPFKEGEEVWLHFDAKYRVEDLGELFGDEARADDEAGEAVGDQVAIDTGGESKRDDLLKMHAYRDAIRRSVGAYVLYPGTEREDCRLYHEILPGLGAFALRPTEHGDAEGILPLEAFIDAVIDHVALQATQDERARFWMREAHAHWGVDPARSPAAPFLTRPPADTLVLLAPAKSPDHFEWIRTHRLYNVRAGVRRGSVGLGSRELAAEFVLVYEAQTENVELWAVRGEPLLFTQELLLQMAYPDPRGELYYCLELEVLAGLGPAIEITLDRVQKLRRQVPGKVRGAPVAATWLALANTL